MPWSTAAPLGVRRSTCRHAQDLGEITAVQ
jgi:hypothetical protein